MSEPELALAQALSTHGRDERPAHGYDSTPPSFLGAANAAVNTLLSLGEGPDQTAFVRYPVDIYNLLGGLELLANRERRVLLRLSSALADLHRQARIAMDPDASQPDAGRAVRDSLAAMDRACRLLIALEAVLDEARQPIACAALRPDVSAGRGASR